MVSGPPTAEMVVVIAVGCPATGCDWIKAVGNRQVPRRAGRSRAGLGPTKRRARASTPNSAAIVHRFRRIMQSPFFRKASVRDEIASTARIST